MSFKSPIREKTNQIFKNMDSSETILVYNDHRSSLNENGEKRYLSKSFQPPVHQQPIFKIDSKINEKITLWRGSMVRLNVDAIVHATNERFERSANSFTNELYQAAGSKLRDCLFGRVRHCQTGSIKITNGFSIASKYIIHTASPYYKQKFHSASENALFQCYQHVLLAAKHYGFRTLALSSLALANQNYPESNGIHLGLRVVRRFLEFYPEAFDFIVFVVENEHQYKLYDLMMRLYFPRTIQEERMECFYLPKNLGGRWGEPVIPERAIRIKKNPVKVLSKIDELDGGNFGARDENHGDGLNEDSKKIKQNPSPLPTIDECREQLNRLEYQKEFPLEEDADHNRNSISLTKKFRTSSIISFKLPGKPTSLNPTNNNHSIDLDEEYSIESTDQMIINQYKTQLKFERLLKSTRRTEKTIDESFRQRIRHCIFSSDETHLMNPTKTNYEPKANRQNNGDEMIFLTIIGHELDLILNDPALIDHVLVHLLQILDRISRTEYSVIYFNTLMTNGSTTSSGGGGGNTISNVQSKTILLLTRLFDYLTYKHRKSLKKLYVVHPTVLARLYLWWFRTFHKKFLRNKIFLVSQVKQIEQLPKGYVLGLPSFIKDQESCWI